MARTKTPRAPRITAAEKAERISQITRMRNLRYTWDQIGSHFKITATRACQIYKEALANHPLSAFAIDDHRVEELQLIDDMIQRMLMIMADTKTLNNGAPAVSARTKVEASATIRAWSERKAKLLGLDAPAQMQITSLSAMDMEIRRLEIEMDMKPGEEIPALN